MDRRIDQAGWLARVAGSGAVRAVVNHAFKLDARIRVANLAAADPVAAQHRQLTNLITRARATQFGRDHHFDQIHTPRDFQARVPLRTYEQIWDEYIRDRFPVLDNLLWPGRIPYFALTSGTTRGATKYIPVSAEMAASNRKGARTMLAYHLANRPDSRLFHGRIFFLGGSTQLETPAPGVQAGDLSGVAAIELADWLRPYTFPPLALALESDWDRKLERFAHESRHLPITLVGGVPAWLLILFERLLTLTGKRTIAEVWPTLELVVHGGVRFDPYRDAFQSILGSNTIRLQETYPCSEGFIGFGDPETGLLRLVHDHGLFYEFIPRDQLDSPHPDRRWLGNVEPGVDYAIAVSTCAGMWAHVIGDVVRFERQGPPLFRFIGRTRDALSAFGEHLISDEVEHALAHAAERTGARVRDWHVGPVFAGRLGYHQYVVEFQSPPDQPEHFRNLLDARLAELNADYQAHRAPGVGMPKPALVIPRAGGFESWMRARGKLGGQHKVPRMDPAGTLTHELVAFLERTAGIEHRIEPADHPPITTACISP